MQNSSLLRRVDVVVLVLWVMSLVSLTWYDFTGNTLDHKMSIVASMINTATENGQSLTDLQHKFDIASSSGHPLNGLLLRVNKVKDDGDGIVEAKVQVFQSSGTRVRSMYFVLKPVY